MERFNHNQQLRIDLREFATVGNALSADVIAKKKNRKKIIFQAMKGEKLIENGHGIIECIISDLRPS